MFTLTPLVPGHPLRETPPVGARFGLMVALLLVVFVGVLVASLLSLAPLSV